MSATEPDETTKAMARLALAEMTDEERATVDRVAAQRGVSRLDVVIAIAVEVDPR